MCRMMTIREMRTYITAARRHDLTGHGTDTLTPPMRRLQPPRKTTMAVNHRDGEVGLYGFTGHGVALYRGARTDTGRQYEQRKAQAEPSTWVQSPF